MAGLNAAPAQGAPPAVELNSASRADLESLPAIGPALAERLLQERSRGAFQAWPDLIRRVPGIGARRAQQLSDAGLRVQAQPFRSAVAAAASEAG